MPGKSLTLILFAVVALSAGIWVGQILSDDRPEPLLEIAGIHFDQPKAVEPFALIDQSGEAFTEQDLRDRWSFLFFGYTYCPDVCPMALGDLNMVQRRLAELGQAENTTYRLISVDPGRDTPARLKEYTTYFNPEFRGATGTPEELVRFAKQFGIYFQVNDDGSGAADYTVDHSSTVTLIDPDGRLHAIFTDHTPQRVTADFVAMRQRYEASN